MKFRCSLFFFVSLCFFVCFSVFVLVDYLLFVVLFLHCCRRRRRRDDDDGSLPTYATMPFPFPANMMLVLALS